MFYGAKLALRFYNGSKNLVVGLIRTNVVLFANMLTIVATIQARPHELIR